MSRIHEGFDIQADNTIFLGSTKENTDEEKSKVAGLMCNTCTDNCKNTDECVLDMLGLKSEE